MLLGVALYFAVLYAVTCIGVVVPLVVWSRARGATWRGSEALGVLLPGGVWTLLALSACRTKGFANGYELLGIPVFLGAGIVIRTKALPRASPYVVIGGQIAAVLFAIVLFFVVPPFLGE